MKNNNDKKYLRIGIFVIIFLFGLFASLIEKNGWIALITCVAVPLLYIPYGISDWKRKKQDNSPEKQPNPKNNDDYKYTKDESEKDAHKLAVKARSGRGDISVLKAKPSSSAKTTIKKSEKNSIAHKTKNRSADEEAVEKNESNKESWQSYNTMLRTRYPNMNQYLVLRSWVHPTRPGEYDGGLALIRTGEIWYFCVDDYFFCVGEDMFKHCCYPLPDDFFDNRTWENFEDKLRSVNWEAGAAVSAFFDGEAEDKAEIEKLFTRSPYRTMFKTAYERNFLGQGQRPYSCILETKESVLSIHIETGELTEKTRSIVQEFYASESYDDPISPYEVTHSERALSYDDLPALVEASKDKAAERYRGMTAYNWRDYFDETKGNQGTGCGSNGNSVITGM